MNRDELIEKLKSEEIDNMIVEKKKEMYFLLKREKEKFCKSLVDAFELLINGLNETDLQEEYSCIMISFLRVGILNDSYDWYIELKNESGYLDDHEHALCFSMKEFFKPLEILEKEIKRLFAEYKDTLNDCDAERIKIEVFEFFIPCFYMIGCYAFRNIIRNVTYQKIHKSSTFKITFGEYMDKYQILHVNKSDFKKNEDFWKRVYSPTEENGFTSLEFIYVNLDNEKLTEECIAYKNFLYGSFYNSQFINQQVVSCNLIGVNFSHVLIKDSNFYFNLCYDTDFSNSRIEMSTISYSYFSDGTLGKDHITPGIGAANFDGAIIKYVEFSNCLLSGCHFENAELKQVKFTNSDLSGTTFRKEDLNDIILSKEQLEQIVLV